ncbi:MAG: hypothetical protein IKC53_03265, partial [Lentisphaeria bacterium]|nr:hypothetical protein [Lentisphaeria bacterium]
ADKKLVLMKVDFPVAIHLQPKSLSQQNKALRTEYGISILPTALLLDANGKIYIDFVKNDGSMEKHRRKMNEIMDFDPPKRYTEYLDGFVKKYTPPKQEEKKAEAKAETKKPAKTSAAKKPDKKPAEKVQDTNPAETNIPDENGVLRIPLNPEGDFQEWLKAYQAEEAKEEAMEAEEAKELIEELKEALEDAAEDAKDTAEKMKDAAEEAKKK